MSSSISKFDDHLCQEKVISLHLCCEELLTICGSIAPTILHSLLEVLPLLRHNYQSRLVLAERTNLLRLARNVILFEGTVAQPLPIENSRKEALLLSLGLLFFFLHGGRVGFLGAGLAGGVGHVDAEHVDCVVVRSRRDKPRIPAKLQVVNFCFVGTPTEHKWTRWILSVNFPDTDQSALFTCCSQQISMSIQGHSCNRPLMTHYDSFCSVRLRKTPNFHMAFLCMRNGQHAAILRI